MTYSCSDFTDTILDALHCPPEAYEADSPSTQADACLERIAMLYGVRDAALVMLKALKELREWDALQGHWNAPCFDHMRDAIMLAEKAGITTGENDE